MKNNDYGRDFYCTENLELAKEYLPRRSYWYPIVNASQPEARALLSHQNTILEKISSAIDGAVIQENDTFYVVKKDGRKIDFSLETEGLRKLTLEIDS